MKNWIWNFLFTFQHLESWGILMSEQSPDLYYLVHLIDRAYISTEIDDIQILYHLQKIILWLIENVAQYEGDCD